MSAPTAPQVLAAVRSSGVRYQLHPGWDDPALNPHGSRWAPAYVMEHHTAGSGQGDAPSLGWVLRPGSLAPVRACHFLVARSGLVHVIYALGCFHAGAGGPGQWGDGPRVPADVMNAHAYGIEIESRGTSLSTANGNGYTEAQLDATARVSAALLDLLGRSTACAINHRTWAPRRKTDTLLSDAEWHRLIAPHRRGATPGPTPPPPGGPTVSESPMFLSETVLDGRTTWWVVSPVGMVNVNAAHAGTWTGARMRVTDRATWERMVAMWPQRPRT